MTSTPAGRLRTSVSRLATLLSYWTPSRFAAAASPLIGDAVTALCPSPVPAAVPAPLGSVADQLHRVVQALADLGADAEGRPHRAVPFPAEPSTFADQLTVVSADLLDATDDAQLLDPLTERLDALRAVL